jgi:hypothetical protein
MHLCAVRSLQGLSLRLPNYAQSLSTPLPRCSFRRFSGSADLCQADQCSIAALYGSNVGSIPLYCARHARRGDTDVKSKRCEEESCESLRPQFGNPSELVGRFCATHQRPGDIDVTIPHCEQEGCTSINPKFGNDEDGVPRYCKTHREAGHVNVMNHANLPHESPGSVGG